MTLISFSKDLVNKTNIQYSNNFPDMNTSIAILEGFFSFANKHDLR